MEPASSKKEPSSSIYLSPQHKEKIKRLQGTLTANGITASVGCIYRTLIETLDENDIEFRGLVRVQAEKDRKIRRGKLQRN